MVLWTPDKYSLPKLLGLFTSDAAPVLDSPKIPYFWRIRHAPLDIFEKSEQHSSHCSFFLLPFSCIMPA
ncbi:hypothetical protein R3W88_033924 [Solanum pinnatisectum]|uniref:Uncharacterized protein n=1 Tax=Solanum pinnatisectum TaxID=50273 RepID=A0AAV9JZY2_9SOLN|nr:hypothetical protein R3W88_033924 [Solanum pinnatisectum]